MADDVAVVTGAGSGIGRAAAAALAARGLRVYCVGLRKAPLAQTAAALGKPATAVAADLGTETGVNKVRDAVLVGEALAGGPITGHRPVRALVHAAEIECTSPFADTERMEFDELFDVNLGGPFFLTQALEPLLADGAGVVFVSSTASVRGGARQAAYAATKAGLLGLTVNLAAELAPRVRVNCVSPGGTRAPMFEQGVAASIVHLALDASHCTGATLVVDGGSLAS
jgi:NAD(P)-dependent dehydrogenase (short-subunit alcohol dehydrogenase family)